MNAMSSNSEINLTHAQMRFAAIGWMSVYACFSHTRSKYNIDKNNTFCLVLLLQFYGFKNIINIK